MDIGKISMTAVNMNNAVQDLNQNVYHMQRDTAQRLKIDIQAGDKQHIRITTWHRHGFQSHIGFWC